MLACVRDRWLLPFVRPDRRVVEIGSGGGRWTRYLLEASHVWCVDLNPQMFRHLLDRFGAPGNLSFYATSGTDLPPGLAGTVDFVFSFGTFVHLDPEVVDAYLAGARALLREGGDLVLQAANKHTPLGARNKGFSPLTPALLEGLLRRRGFRVVDHDAELLPHSSIVHARPDPAAPKPLALATPRAFRLLAWPRWDDPAALVELLAAFGPVLAGRPHVSLCLRVDPAVPVEHAARLLERCSAVLGPDPALDVLLVDDPLPDHAALARLGRAVNAVLVPPGSLPGSSLSRLWALDVLRLCDAAEVEALLGPAARTGDA